MFLSRAFAFLVFCVVDCRLLKDKCVAQVKIIRHTAAPKHKLPSGSSSTNSLTKITIKIASADSSLPRGEHYKCESKYHPLAYLISVRTCERACAAEWGEK
jgi:hypothetical protein